MRHRVTVLLLTSILLVGCGGDNAIAEGGAQEDVALPRPGAVNGSVTGMPDPGIASAPPVAMRAPAIIELPDQIETEQAVAGDAALQPALDSAPPADTLDPRAPAVVMDAPVNAAPANAIDVTDPGSLQQ